MVLRFSQTGDDDIQADSRLSSVIRYPIPLYEIIHLRCFLSNIEKISCFHFCKLQENQFDSVQVTLILNTAKARRAKPLLLLHAQFSRLPCASSSLLLLPLNLLEKNTRSKGIPNSSAKRLVENGFVIYFSVKSKQCSQSYTITYSYSRKHS